jgi:hypothetical protein
MGRLEVLAVTAGVFLILTAPAFAQYPGEPEQTTEASSTAAASSVQDEGQSSADQSVALTESDWWGEDDGLSFGYLPGGFGFGLGSCGSWSQPTGGGSVQWWNAGGTNAWFPAGQQLPYPYGSGWCGNNGYRNRSGFALWVNRIILPTRNHHHTSSHKSATNSNSGPLATAGQAPRELNRQLNPESDADRAGPDDDWTRVDDHIEYSHPQQTAALAHQQVQGTHRLQHGSRSQNPERAHAEQMRALQRGHLAQARGFGTMHVAPPPAAHFAARSVAVRSGGRGHS